MVFSYDDLISVTEAGRRFSSVIQEVEGGAERIVLKNNRAVAAIVPIAQLEAMRELRETLIDVSIMAARMATDSGQRSTLDELLDRFGFTREELLAEEDAEVRPSASESS